VNVELSELLGALLEGNQPGAGSYRVSTRDRRSGAVAQQSVQFHRQPPLRWLLQRTGGSTLSDGSAEYLISQGRVLEKVPARADYLPLEVALAYPSLLPIWGRSSDDYRLASRGIRSGGQVELLLDPQEGPRGGQGKLLWDSEQHVVSALAFHYLEFEVTDFRVEWPERHTFDVDRVLLLPSG